MRVFQLIFACSIVSLVWGCGTSWSFRRARGEVERPALTTAGLRIYAGDVDKVEHSSGAVILGEIEVDGGAGSSFGDVRERASVEAAKIGGTHFTLLSKWTGGRFGSPHAVYVVIRVPPETWETLPEALRPTRL